jgi:DNA topoisomerase-1
MLRRNAGGSSRRDRSHLGRKRHDQFVAELAAPPLIAKQAGLRYVSCSEPGILRIKRGRGFVYRLPDGKLLRSASELLRIRRMALPPAWRDVWICSNSRGHLLATGMDARGRKQYRYHPHWRTVRDEAKYNDLATFGRKLPQLRRALDGDLARAGLNRDKVLATVVAVMERTAARVGNDRGAYHRRAGALAGCLGRGGSGTAGARQWRTLGRWAPRSHVGCG